MTTIFSAIVPRVFLLVGWVNDPTYWNAVFGSQIWLVGGFLVLPWTTFVYGFVQRNGLSLFNWLFILGALALDLGTWGFGVFAGRKEYSSYRGT